MSEDLCKMIEPEEFKIAQFKCRYREGYKKDALLSIMESVVSELKNLEDCTNEEIENEFESYMN